MKVHVRPLVVAALFLAHLSLDLSAGTWPEPVVRINAQPNIVSRSDEPSDYGITVLGDDLYVTWIGQAAFGTDVYLSRVNISTGVRGDDLKITSKRGRGKGARIFPSANVGADDRQFCWLEKGVQRTDEGRQNYFILNTISGRALEAGGEPDLVDYGSQSRPAQFVETSHGLFLVGHSAGIKSRVWDLRIYRHQEEGGFQEVPALSGDSVWGREPVLLESQGILYLFWFRSDAIVASTSADGTEWTPAAEVTSGQRVGFGALRAVVAGDGFKLVWATGDKGSNQVLFVHGKPGHWSEPEELVALHKTLPSLVFGVDSESQGTLVASYRDADEQSQVLISMRERDSWKPLRLSLPGERVQTSREPALHWLDGRTFLAWSQSDRSSPQALAARIYLNQVDGEQSEWLEAPRQISALTSDYSTITPKLFSHDGKLFVTYFSYRMKSSGMDGFAGRVMANPNRGNLHLQQVVLEGKQEGASER